MFLPFSTVSELVLLTLLLVAVLMAARTYHSRGTKAFRTYILTTCIVPFILVVGLVFIATQGSGAESQLQKDVQPGVKASYKVIPAAQPNVERQWIDSCQSSNGYLTMGKGSPEINPYFANLTEMALVTQPQYLGGVKKYLEWYISHLNHPDKLGLYGTIYNYRLINGVIHSVYSYDSADSYAATLLSLIYAYYRSSGDTNFICAHYRDLTTVAETITALQGADGLVWSKPDYPICDLMDNCEDYRGLKDWSSLLAALGYKSQSQLYDRKAELIRNAVLEQFWDPNTKAFAWAVDDRGNKSLLSADQSYPGLFAQIYPVTFGVITPTNPKAVLAYKELNKELPRWSELQVGDPLPWSILGYAAVKMGDLSRTELFLRNCYSTYIMNNHKYPWSTFESGFYVRALAILQKETSAATGSTS